MPTIFSMQAADSHISLTTPAGNFMRAANVKGISNQLTSHLSQNIGGAATKAAVIVSAVPASKPTISSNAMSIESDMKLVTPLKNSAIYIYKLDLM